MHFDPDQLIKDHNPRPAKMVKRFVDSFFHTKIYRELKKYFKINNIYYTYCRQKSKEELAFYIMGTKKDPIIILCDDVLKKTAVEWGKEIGIGARKLLIYHTMIHELTHAYLDHRGLKRQSEHLVDDFSYNVLAHGLKASKRILIRYINRRNNG